MFARITPYQMKPEKMEEALALIEKLKPRIMGLPGLKQLINLSNDDGSGYIISVVESQATSDQNAAAVQAIWAEFKDHLQSMPTPQGYGVNCNWSN